MVNVYISVINFNSPSDTRVCLQSLEKLHKKDIKISVLLVDNSSKEPIGIKPGEFTSLNLTILRSAENLGFSGGHNKAITYALEHNADYVMILNNDTFVDKNFLQELLIAFQSDKKAGVVAPKIYFAKGYEFHKDRYRNEELGKVIWYAGGVMDWENVIGHHRGVDEVDEGQYDEIDNTEYASGCCMLIKREVFERVGIFDERYFLYYEDNDFNMRMRRQGYHIVYAPKSFLWHKNAGSAGGSGSSLQDYFISRNRLLFGMKYSPIRTRLALLRESIWIFAYGRKWQKRGVRDFYLRRLGKGSYNI